MAWIGANQVKLWMYVALAAIVALFIGWFIIRGYEIDSLQKKLTDAQAQVNVVSQMREQELKSRKAAEKRANEIRNTPAKDDGPVSNVLRDSLNRLQ
jgi:predicted Holliday junction resolvase-like endonuclease